VQIEALKAMVKQRAANGRRTRQHPFQQKRAMSKLLNQNYTACRFMPHGFQFAQF
jgi:hypothetical protein